MTSSLYKLTISGTPRTFRSSLRAIVSSRQIPVISTPALGSSMPLLYVPAPSAQPETHLQRPCAVATSGTPISHDYDTETSVFTYRYRTPLRLSKSIPAQADLTEFFVPKRIYPEGKTSIQLSSGGRCTFDWPNERLYVWWSDIYPPHGGPTDRLRRVDVWVPEKRAKTRGWETEYIVKWVVFVVLALLVAYGAIRLQMLELEKDQSYGFKELWGYKLDDLLRGRLVLAEK